MVNRMPVNMSERIVSTPGTCGGKPRIAGHRIRVQDVAIWYERLGMTPDAIVDEYPTITLSDVHVALAYYYDHVEEIQQQIREGEAYAAEMAAKTPSLLRQKLAERNEKNKVSS